MKRTLLYLMLFVLTGFNAKGQVILTKDWEIKPVASSGLILTSGNTTTIAYNKITDKIYLPDRNNKINILNTDGTLSTPSVLAVNAAWTESYKYTKIRVADDGAIYAVNMTLGAGTLYVYRWANEADAAPTRSAITVSLRTGDSFAVSGTGVNTILYISGANNTLIYVCTTTDGVNFTHTKSITLTAASDARSSISPVTNSLESDLWINTLNVEAKRISVNASGAITATSNIVTSVIPQVYSHAEYFEEGGKKFLAVSGAHNNPLGLNFLLYDITNLSSVTQVATGVLEPDAYTANANAYADVAIKRNTDGTYTFFHLAFANGLASYTTSTALPVSLTTFSASIQNNQSALTWLTASESNNKGFEVLRSTDGENFSSIGFVASKAVNGNSNEALSYSFVDANPVYGTNYYRLKQIDLDGVSALLEIKSVNYTLKGEDIVVYPNPTPDFIKIKSSKGTSLDIKLYDFSGKELINKKSSENLTELSLRELNVGIYVLKIYDNGEEIYSSKIIKK